MRLCCRRCGRRLPFGQLRFGCGCPLPARPCVAIGGADVLFRPVGPPLPSCALVGRLGSKLLPLLCCRFGFCGFRGDGRCCVVLVGSACCRSAAASVALAPPFFLAAATALSAVARWSPLLCSSGPGGLGELHLLLPVLLARRPILACGGLGCRMRSMVQGIRLEVGIGFEGGCEDGSSS